MLTKKCTRCGEEKCIEDFPLCRGVPRARCKPCHSADAADWVKRNQEAYKKRLREHYYKTRVIKVMGPPLPPAIKKQRQLEKRRQWAAANKESNDASKKKWAEKNKHISMEVVRRRQANKLKATPAWANRKAMQLIYWQARQITEILGECYDVDHIVPLQGATVCGLHCEANLQFLPSKENRRKHNRYWPDMP